MREKFMFFILENLFIHDLQINIIWFIVAYYLIGYIPFWFVPTSSELADLDRLGVVQFLCQHMPYYISWNNLTSLSPTFSFKCIQTVFESLSPWWNPCVQTTPKVWQALFMTLIFLSARATFLPIDIGNNQQYCAILWQFLTARESACSQVVWSVPYVGQEWRGYVTSIA